MRILIAEDERITRASLLRQLQAWGHDVQAAEDGEQARDLLEKAEFDIVLTDWDMPRLSGLELVRRLRAAGKSGDRAGFVYVVMLTGRSDKSDVVQGIEAGADDFLSKPFDREELRVRLLAGERIVRLERALSAQNLELRAASDRMHRDLRAAARLQRAMLPAANVINPRVRTAWTYVPTDELAGDALGIHLADDRFLSFYVVDVSGHGVQAALLAVRLMHAMSPAEDGGSLLGALAREGGAHPSRVLTELNRRFTSGDLDGRFLTMSLCCLDTARGTLSVARAGHPLPLIVRRGSPVGVQDKGGLPIGILGSEEYEDVAVQLEPGDRTFLFSDGFLEQPEPAAQTLFGEPRLTEFLSSRSGVPGEQLVTLAVDRLAEWADSRRFEDDLSLLAVEWTGDPAGATPAP